MLQESGWPRKQGLLGKNVIDSNIFDSVIDQMVNWGAALGAGRPKVALQVLTYMFGGVDWNGPEAPKIKLLVEDLNSKYEERRKSIYDISPTTLVEPVRIAEKFGETIRAEALTDKRLTGRLEQDFMFSLLFGLGNKALFEDWHKKQLEKFDKHLPLMKKAHLDIGKLPTLKENYSDCEQIIRNYEGEMDIKLPPIPPTLTADARALGVSV